MVIKTKIYHGLICPIEGLNRPTIKRYIRKKGTTEKPHEITCKIDAKASLNFRLPANLNKSLIILCLLIFFNRTNLTPYELIIVDFIQFK